MGEEEKPTHIGEYPIGTHLRIYMSGGVVLAGRLDDKETARELYLNPSLIYEPIFDDKGEIAQKKQRLEENLPITAIKDSIIGIEPISEEFFDRIARIGNTSDDEEPTEFTGLKPEIVISGESGKPKRTIPRVISKRDIEAYLTQGRDLK